MNTRVLTISDIHANYEALKTLQPLVDECDAVICAGDFVGYYCQVNEVCDLVRGWNPICVRGNHDEYLLRGCPPSMPESVRFGIEFAARTIDPDHRRWLTSLPLVWGGMAGGLSMLLAHGSPYRPLEDYLYENKIAGARLDAFAFDLLIFGQTHRPIVRTDARPALLNPGSVGQSRNVPGIVCGAIVHTEPFRIEPFQHAYDTSLVLQLARENGAGDWITKHLPAT